MWASIYGHQVKYLGGSHILALEAWFKNHTYLWGVISIIWGASKRLRNLGDDLKV